MDGTDEYGRRVTRSLRTHSRQVAQNLIREVEARGYIWGNSAPEPITIQEACEKFLAANTHLSKGRIKKYKLLFARMEEFAQRQGLRYLLDLDLNALTDFRTEWSDRWQQQAGTICLNIQKLRKFFRFGHKRKWVDENPACDLEMPQVKLRPTLPFTAEEWRRILAAFPLYEQRAGRAAAQRLYAFVLLLRYSGMRIGDAVRSEVSWVQGDRISFLTEKNNVRVCNKLPDFVLQALWAAPCKSERHFFWSGASTLHSAVGKWQRRLRVLFDLAGVRSGHAHRFRDTYAEDMAFNGTMTLEELKQALGHKSTGTTEKYYLHWIQERQGRLEEKQERAWNCDPLLQQHAGNSLSGKGERVN